MTLRYKDNLMVIGNDLRNEPRPDKKNGTIPLWGTGMPSNDWRMAATKAGNAVLALNPDQLIFIEGLLGGIMTPAYFAPVKLDVANRLVYSAHAYSWTYNFRFYKMYEIVYDLIFGFVTKSEDQEYSAPMWVGEFGTNDNKKYWNATNRYIKERKLHYAHWPYNGDNGNGNNESFGEVDGTYKNIRYPYQIYSMIHNHENGSA